MSPNLIRGPPELSRYPEGVDMDDRTESFETYEPESYEWDYEEAADRPPRVLWGRIIALAVLVLFAFVLGRRTAPAVDNSAELAAANERADQAESEIRDLEAQLSEMNAAAQTEDEPTPEPTSESSAAPAAEGETYIVKSGDSLAGIALKFYGDSSLANVIAEANSITDPQSIRPGDELIIPPEPSN
jgi:nucleoid-associated protein YgaU